MTKTTDINALHQTINTIDLFSQEGLSEVEAIAKLALAYMERPNASKNPENITQALKAIARRASGLMNDINAMAEDVGCNHREGTDKEARP